MREVLRTKQNKNVLFILKNKTFLFTYSTMKIFPETRQLIDLQCTHKWITWISSNKYFKQSIHYQKS